MLKSGDVTEEARPLASPAVRLIFLLLGTLCLGLGLLGILLPILPTTPFLLLAASCYARASSRFYNALLSNRLFGPTIRQWREGRSIPLKTKIVAVSLLVATLGTSMTFFIQHNYLRIALALLGVALLAFLIRIPTTAEPVAERG